MAADKHTPGPWEVLDGRRIGVTLPSSVEGCGFDSHCVALTHSDRPEINAEANACLIAASPDLLAALRRCAQRILTDEGVNSPIYQMAKAAIDKAEGKA